MQPLCFKQWLEDVETVSHCYYFGTFDPIHNDHVQIAKSVADKGHIIVFVPAAQSPDKVGRKSTPHAHRVAMCKIVGDKYGWTVNDIEEKLPKPNRSITTLRALDPEFDTKKTRTPFIMGADNVTNLHHWHVADELARRLKIYAISRDGIAPVNNNLPDIDVKVVESPTQNLSSTAIRKAIETGQPFEQWVDPDVAKYIKQHNLYAA